MVIVNLWEHYVRVSTLFVGKVARNPAFAIKYSFKLLLYISSLEFFKVLSQASDLSGLIHFRHEIDVIPD